MGLNDSFLGLYEVTKYNGLLRIRLRKPDQSSFISSFSIVIHFNLTGHVHFTSAGIIQKRKYF